jgi:amidase
MAEELWRLSAGELARGIRTRRFSSRDAVEAHLSRIDAVNPSLNAVVKVLAAEARAGADAADAAVAAGAPLGALHGVPFTIKENIDVAGQATTNGMAVFAEAIATEDAPVVARMKAAGAIPLGRTNMPDMGLRIHTDSSLYGRTRNPWEADRTPGGSSGGEGAALASGMSPIGLGNDIGGSLRNPAHACGVASLKPSTGVIPDTQTFPVPDRALSSQVMLNQGVMARRVSDVRLGTMVVAGPDPRDPVSVPARLTDLAPGEKLTVAVMAEPPGGSTHPEVVATVRAAADALSAAGHRVVEATPPDYEMSMLLWAGMLFNELHDVRDQIEPVMGTDARAIIAASLARFPRMSSLEVYLMHAQRDGVARRWGHWFEDHQVLLCPTWTQPAFMAGADVAGEEESVLELMRPVLPGNLLGLPCAVVPAGMAGNLPVGVQVMGARYTDLRVLAVAEQIENRLGLPTPIDPRP